MYEIKLNKLNKYYFKMPGGNQYGKFFSKGFNFSKFSKNLNKSKYQSSFINANMNLNKFSVSLFNNMNFHMVNSITNMNLNSSNFAFKTINAFESEVSQEEPTNGNEVVDIALKNNNNWKTTELSTALELRRS